MRSLVAVALLLVACSDPSSSPEWMRQEQPSAPRGRDIGLPRAPEHPTVFVPRQPAPARHVQAPTGQTCRADSDCAVVEVSCVGLAAVQASGAAALRGAWEREAARLNCVRRGGVAPRLLAAYCEAGQCQADVVEWPDLRHCTHDDECTEVAEPCRTTPLGVAKSRRAGAERLFAALARTTPCPAAGSEEIVGGPDPRRGRCERAFCRP